MPPARPKLSLLPIGYYALAHTAALVAFLLLGGAPTRYTGFFYHPRLIAVTHLLTLGWITGSILGSLLMIGPMALRMRRRNSRIDRPAFWLFAAGVGGMVFHYWRGAVGGAAWSAAAIVLALALALSRAARDLRNARLPWTAKLPFALAFFNLLLATGWGIVLALNRIVPLLGPLALENLYAHVHMAALGWGTLMVLAAGYRLLPMLLPSAMPDGRAVALSVLLLELGSLGLFAAFVCRSPLGLRGAALLAAGGIGLFLWQVGWMLRNPRPAPQGRRLPDWGLLHCFQALIYLALATVSGTALAWAPDASWAIRYGGAYGALGLAGFLTQVVIGVQARLIPLFAWFHAYEADGLNRQPPSPHATPVRGLQAATFILWTMGVPLLATGFGLERPELLRVGAWTLASALALNGAGIALTFRRATFRS